MQFPEKEIYTELIAELTAKAYYFTELTHPAPAHFDWDREQYEVEGEKNDFPFVRPAIFFRFDETPYTRKGSSTRNGIVPLTIICVQDKYVDSMQGSDSQPEYLKLLEWKYLINHVLDGFRGSCFGPLDMESMGTDHRNRNLHVERINYKLNVVISNPVIPPPL